MSNGLPTFSALDRAKVCAGSCALPQIQRKTKYAEKGDAVHDFVLSKKRGDEKLLEIPEQFRALCESIDIDAIPVGRYEVAFGFDADTGLARIIGENLKRDYPKDVRVGELVGSADIFTKIKLGDQEAVYIGDVKTGHAAHVPPVRDCLQVGAAAVAAARVEGLQLAVVEIVRIKDSGDVFREPAVLDNWALDAIELELTELVRSVRREQAVAAAGGVVSVVSGGHCQFCPAYAFCPDKKNLAMALADPKSLEREIMGALTPESAPVVYKKYKAAQEMLNRIRNAIYGYAEQQEFDIGNGFVLGPVQVVTPKLDAALVHRIVTRDYGVEAANKVVDWRTSKRAIKAVLREFCKYGTLARTEQRLLGELRLDGGVIDAARTEIRPHKSGVDTQEADDD